MLYLSIFVNSSHLKASEKTGADMTYNSTTTTTTPTTTTTTTTTTTPTTTTTTTTTPPSDAASADDSVGEGEQFHHHHHHHHHHSKPDLATDECELMTTIDRSHMRTSHQHEHEHEHEHEREHEHEYEHEHEHEHEHGHDHHTDQYYYIGATTVIGGVLEVVEKCLQDLRNSHPSLSSHETNTNSGNQQLENYGHSGIDRGPFTTVDNEKELMQRSSRLLDMVQEALKRFHLVNSIPPPIPTKNATFMARMTASPNTLVTYCLRAGDYSRCEEIIRFFSLHNQPQAQEARLAKQLDDLLAHAHLTSTISTAPTPADSTTHSDSVISAFGIPLFIILLFTSIHKYS
jgi:hypothetical protein